MSRPRIGQDTCPTRRPHPSEPLVHLFQPAVTHAWNGKHGQDGRTVVPPGNLSVGDRCKLAHEWKRRTQRQEAVSVGAVGGGGGESNSPSKKRLPGYTTGLVGFHYVAWPSSADRVGSSHPAFVFLELRQLSLKAPRHFGAHSQPTGERLG